MFTVVETAMFSRLWPAYWSEEERGAFAVHLAGHPDAGDVIRAQADCARCAGAAPDQENLVGCA